jgi:hypothetical protein
MRPRSNRSSVGARPALGPGAAACGAWIALLVLLAALPALGQGVQVALIPPQFVVAPGAGFDLELDVTEAGSVFNGFTVIVGYDPSALTFVPASPIRLQEGCLMTGACSAACGQTFHDFHAAGDSLVITDILMCNEVLLPGPGQIYKLHFTASTTLQTTTVQVRRAEFYHGGSYVTPVETHAATIGIGVEVGVGAGGPPGAAPRVPLRVAPNPTRGAAAIRVDAGAGREQRLMVCDLSGRKVRRLQSVDFASSGRDVLWDGRDDRGIRLAAGVYLVVLQTAGRTYQARVVLLQ